MTAQKIDQATRSSAFMAGDEIEILEKGKVIDHALVKRVENNPRTDCHEVTIESQRLHPRERSTFISFSGGLHWLLLFEDPFTGAPCYNSRYDAPHYVLRKKS